VELRYFAIYYKGFVRQTDSQTYLMCVISKTAKACW